jgi:NAD(P)-dependent dehydrogenase (short-subunit alcohol dehydrogenase family)
MSTLLKGLSAVVTGGGSGIGRATARRFAAEGAHVVVNDLSAESAAATVDLIRADGGRAEAEAGDVTDSAFVDALVAKTTADHDGLHVFHSNAGNGLARAALAEVDDTGWLADMNLNLNAMFYCVRAAGRVMTGAGRGSIVCTSSGAGLGFVAHTGPYGTAKAALLHLVKVAAAEYGPSGVRVNAVIPGAVKTPAFMGYIGDEDRLAQYEAQIPLGRACRPEDIAAAVTWLASDEAYCVTGTSIISDGGGAALRTEPRIG